VLAAVEDVVTASGRAAGSQTAALTARLAEVAGNEAAAEQLRAGRLGSAELDAVDPFAGLEPPHRSAGGRAATDRADANRDVAKRSSARSSARRAAERAGERAGEPPTAGGRRSGRGAAGPDAQGAEAAPGRSHVSAADRAAAKQALVAARKERAAARSELTTAQRVLDRAEATAAKAAAELAEARERVATAQQRAVDAERRWTAAFQRGAQNVPR
jgi:exonuclease SbcC